LTDSGGAIVNITSVVGFDNASCVPKTLSASMK
jgi:hypothetical protein